jgi:hypothetical protein
VNLLAQPDRPTPSRDAWRGVIEDASCTTALGDGRVVGAYHFDVTNVSSARDGRWAISASVVGFGMLAIYVALILSEGNDSISEVLPWIGLMAVAATLALITAFIQNVQSARMMLIGSAVVYFAIGAVSILSIGIGFIIAGVIAVVGVARLSRLC